MPIKAYSLLKCKPLQYGIGSGHPPGGKPKQGGHPHFQILAEGKKGQLHRIAVNIISGEAKPGKGDSLIRMKLDKTFKLDALTQKLKRNTVTFGFHPVASKPGDMALDFVRLPGLADTKTMKKMPFTELGPDNDLQDILTGLLDEAIREACVIYAFGATWTDNKTVFFANEKGGIHDIHANQGNPRGKGHDKDNGIWQDGALLIHDTKKDTWKAIFMAFESQFTGAAIATDDKGFQLKEPAKPVAPKKKTPAKKAAKKPAKKPAKKKKGK